MNSRRPRTAYIDHGALKNITARGLSRTAVRVDRFVSSRKFTLRFTVSCFDKRDLSFCLSSNNNQPNTVSAKITRSKKTRLRAGAAVIVYGSDTKDGRAAGHVM